MRIVALLLLLSIPIAAGTMESASVTCEGVVYLGTGSASCSAIDLPYYAVSAEANAGLAMASEEDGGASAQFTADFVVTITGGAGGGFFDPNLYASATSSGYGAGGAQATLSGSSYGCIATPSGSNCGPMSFPFLFGVPETLTLTLNADAVGAPGSAWAAAGYGPFEFFDGSGQPLSGVSYTFLPVGPVPELGTLLLTAIGCGILGVVRRRRKR